MIIMTNITVKIHPTAGHMPLVRMRAHGPCLIPKPAEGGKWRYFYHNVDGWLIIRYLTFFNLVDRMLTMNYYSEERSILQLYHRLFVWVRKTTHTEVTEQYMNLGPWVDRNRYNLLNPIFSKPIYYIQYSILKT